MQFIITALDGANMLEKRKEVRPRHLSGMEQMSTHIICAGGILDDSGKPKGSVLVLDFPDRTGLDAYLKNEPYVQEHVWKKIDIQEMNVVIVNGEKVGK